MEKHQPSWRRNALVPPLTKKTYSIERGRSGVESDTSPGHFGIVYKALSTEFNFRFNYENSLASHTVHTAVHCRATLHDGATKETGPPLTQIYKLERATVTSSSTRDSTSFDPNLQTALKRKHSSLIKGATFKTTYKMESMLAAYHAATASPLLITIIALILIILVPLALFYPVSQSATPHSRVMKRNSKSTTNFQEVKTNI